MRLMTRDQAYAVARSPHDELLPVRVAAARVARLATVRADGTPHIVAVTFALEEDTVVSVVDHKPKRTRELQRLRNLEGRPTASLLVDHYEDD